VTAGDGRGRGTMPGYRVEIDATRCIGSGQCVARAPEVFDQREEDGIVVLLLADPGPARREAVEKAALLCPAQAISVVETS